MFLALVLTFVMAVTAMTGTALARAHKHAKKPAKPAVSQEASPKRRKVRRRSRPAKPSRFCASACSRGHLH